MPDATLYASRLLRVQQFLKNSQCDALLVDDPVNLYYLTGIEISQGKILVFPKDAFLIVDGRYLELCNKMSPIPTRLLEQNTLTDLLREVKSLAFSSETTTYKNFLELNTALKEMELSLVPYENPIKLLRGIKDKTEIETLRLAAELGSEGFDFISTILREGITELEIAMELEIFWKRKGGKGVAFDPIIAFGANSSMPHYRAGNTQLKSGDCVLIDIGVNLKHYHSDMTRVLFFGKPDPKIVEIYSIVKKAQKAALDLCLPGTLIGQLDQAARDVIASYGYAENFTHSLGHGVGLEIHEWPTLRNTSTMKNIPLEKGMVITIEPGIYLPGLGGVRLEDTVLITSDGHENLTNRPLTE